MVWSTALYVAGLALLTKVSALVCVAVTVTVAGAEVAPLPEAVAVLVIEPASRSACVRSEDRGEGNDGRGASGPVQHANVPSLTWSIVKRPANVMLLQYVTV